jgi:hypothetical protein
VSVDLQVPLVDQLLPPQALLMEMMQEVQLLLSVEELRQMSCLELSGEIF